MVTEQIRIHLNFKNYYKNTWRPAWITRPLTLHQDSHQSYTQCSCRSKLTNMSELYDIGYKHFHTTTGQAITFFVITCFQQNPGKVYKVRKVSQGAFFLQYWSQIWPSSEGKSEAAIFFQQNSTLIPDRSVATGRAGMISTKGKWIMLSGHRENGNRVKELWPGKRRSD